MQNKKIKIIIILLVAAGIGFFVLKSRQNKTAQEEVKEVMPKRGNIESIISTTGTVLPKNRLEVKPPVNGRVEEILIKEGDIVKTGEELARMSSTERAAILDAARGKGEEDLKYWEDTYKPILLVSPIDGEVIVATVQPGQAITTSDAVVVLSDHLIIRAQVDETDIGKIKEGQEAVVTLDAYPDARIKGKVEHIYHESKTINNVIIYEVDVIPNKMPVFFRSGMSASIDFKEEGREDALLLPEEAVTRSKDGAWVWLKGDNSREPVRNRVELGISDDTNVEIVSGIKETDTIIIKSKKYALPKNSTGTNPFMPRRR